MDFIKTTKEEVDEITKCDTELLHKVYKKTFAYELEKIIVNEDGKTTHLHSDRFIDEHTERRNSQEMTEEKLKELGRLDATAVAKYFRLSNLSYSIQNFTLYPIILSVYVVCSNAFIVASEYALTSPPVPSSIPPKYLVTTTKILDKPCSKTIFKASS